MRAVRHYVPAAIAVIVVGLMVASGVAVAAGGANPRHALRFANSTPIELDAKESNEVRVTVMNNGGEQLPLSFSVQPAQDVTVKATGDLTLPKFTGRQFILDIGSKSGKSYEGNLVVRAPGVVSAFKTLNMAKQPTVLGWLSFFVPVMIGAAFVLFAVVMHLVRPVRVRDAQAVTGQFARLGHAKWSYDKSWGSISGLVVGALAALTSATFLPKERLIDTGSIAAMSFAFGAMIVAAPQIYAGLRSLIDWWTDQGDKGLRLQWYVFAFLLASIVTLSGIIGEGYTMWQLLREMKNSRYMPPAMTDIFMVALAVACLILLLYSRMGISAILRKQYVGKIGQGTKDPQRQAVTPLSEYKDAVADAAEAQHLNVDSQVKIPHYANGIIDIDEPWFVL